MELKNLLNLINKTFRAYKIYPKGHDIPKFFLRQLWDNVKLAISETSKIDLIFDRGRCLDMYGSEIWSEEENDDNIAWVLYKYGIRGITINQEVLLIDLQNIFEAIQNAYVSEDKYSLIFEINQREYSGVSFEFIPEFLQDQNVFIPETYQDFLKLKEKEPSSEPFEVEGQISASIEIPIIIESREVFTITSEEEQLLNEEIAKERESSQIDKVMSYLYKLIEFESEDEANDVIKAVEELILLEINNSGIQKVSRIMQDLRLLKSQLENPEKAKIVGMLFRRLSDPLLLESIVKSYIELKPNELEAFLSKLDPDAGFSLFKIATDLPQKSQRQVILRSILNLQGFDFRRILHYVESNKSEDKVLTAGLEFITLGKFKEAKDFLAELERANDPRMKKNLLEAISAIEGDLTPFFYDPDVQVRMSAYLEMKKNPKKSFASLVVERLKSADLFFKLDALEKKQFMSLVPEYLDYQLVEDAVKNILTQTLSIFGKITKARKYYETLQFLVNSLVESKNKKVYILLIETIKNTKDTKLREMCSEALKQLKE